MLENGDHLFFMYFIDIINKNYQYLSEYRIKGWVLSELFNFKGENIEKYISNIKEKYIQLFALPIVETRNEAEQAVVDDLFSKHNYAEKFFISLEFYLENPNFFKSEFSIKEVIRAMKDYESKVLKF